MKKLILLFTLFSASYYCQQAPFSRGVNLTNWFQSSSPQQIQFQRYSVEDFENVKSLGCDVIRLPVRMHDMTSGAPDYTLDPLFLYFLDEAVGMAEQTGMHLILDNHSFDVTSSTSPQVGEILIPVWTQLAERYSAGYENLYYEILNEPHGIEDSLWNAIQGEVIEAIREKDTFHTIIVGPAGWNSFHNLIYMPDFEDNNLIYTFHFYDPFLFTHQGAGWTDPSMEPVVGIPFPYNSAEMPQCPQELIGTWIEGSYNDYPGVGNESRMAAMLDIAKQFKDQRNVPLFCGEFGVYIPNSENEDRVAWYEMIREMMEERGFVWTTWDYHGGFGLFEKDTPGFFDYDLNIPLLAALGLNTPPQSVYTPLPDSAAVKIYDDFFGKYTYANANTSGEAKLYDMNSPYSGKCSVSWDGGDQYDNLGVDFLHDRDFSRLLNENFILELYIKGDTPGSSIDIRFVDTKTDVPEDHPWRMGLTIDDNLVNWNGEWQLLKIPLSSMQELGSWDNGWFPPQGDFDWTAIDALQIVAEHHSFEGRKFWFDDIRIYDPNATVFDAEKEILPAEFSLNQNYPNPFNPETRINYSLAAEGHITLVVYDMLGRKIKTLVNENKPAGHYSVYFNAGKLPAGVYFYNYNINGFSDTKKMTLLK